MRFRPHFSFMAGLMAATAQIHAQVPDLIQAARFQSFQQTSATGQQFTGAGFGMQVTFRNAPPSGATVQLRGPTGTTTSLTRQPDNSFLLELSYADTGQLMSAFPDGTYTVVVSGGSAPSNTSFSVNAGPPPNPVLITNYDALQSWPNASPAPIWQPISGAGIDDRVELTISQSNGKVLFDSGPDTSAATTSLSANSVPFLTTLNGELDYYHFIISQANNGATNIGFVSGFEVDFSLRCVPAPPTILKDPSSWVGHVGSSVDLTIQASGESMTFRLKKNGVFVSGINPRISTGASTSATFTIPIMSASDAGSYTIEASNVSGATTSNPATLVVAPQLVLTTYAGSGARGALDGTAASAQFATPQGLALDAFGNLYVADSQAATIRIISSTGLVSSVAGAADQFGAVDGVGAVARFRNPNALTIDSVGNIYVTDDSAIRKISPAGVVSTIAGAAGQTGSVDGIGSAARFKGPSGIAVDPVGNLYVSDTENNTVRKITPTGVVSTLAGLAGFYASTDGMGSTARFAGPAGCQFHAGNLYVADSFGVRLVTPAGVVTTLTGLSVDTGNGTSPMLTAGGPQSIKNLAFDPTGAFYQVTLDRIRRTTVGGVTVEMAALVFGGGIVVDALGTVFVSDPLSHVIRKGTWTASSVDPGITINASPRAQIMTPGASLVFSVQATGPALSYQWQKNGVGIPGANSAVLRLQNTTTADLGSYSVLIGNGVGAVSSTSASLSFSNSSDIGRIANLSVRANAGTGAQSLIAGLVLSGGTVPAGKSFLIRGIGPTLSTFGVPDSLADPTLTLFNGANAAIASDDDWGESVTLASVFASVGAFALPANSRDAALSTVLSNGNFSVSVSGKNNTTGTALVEVYDLSNGGAATSGPRLVNLSARMQVGTGANVLTAGFVVVGSTSKTLLIRGVGPSLASFGVVDALSDPQLQIYDDRRALVASNDDVGFSNDPLNQMLVNIARQVGAFSLSTLKDSAVVVTLSPGAYTAQVSGVGGTTGVGLIEIYEVP